MQQKTGMHGKYTIKITFCRTVAKSDFLFGLSQGRVEIENDDEIGVQFHPKPEVWILDLDGC